MPIPLPRLNDSTPLTLGEKLVSPNDIKPVRGWLPVPGKPHLLRNAKGQLRFAPDPPPKVKKQVDPARLQKALDAIAPIFKAHREQADEIRVGDWVRRNPKDAFFGHDSKNCFDGPFKAAFSSLGGDAYVQGPLGAIKKDRLLKCSPDGWIPHTPGDPMPCPEGMHIHYICKSGVRSVKNMGWAAFPDREGRSNWELIIAWKPVL